MTLEHVYTFKGSVLSVAGANDVVFRNGNISNNTGPKTKGIYFRDGGVPDVAYNTINSNPGYGIVFDNTNGYLYNNVIKYNSLGGVSCNSSSSPIFYPPYQQQGLNTIKGGFNGISAYWYAYPFFGDGSGNGYNDVDSTIQARVAADYYSAVYAGNTWWGATDPYNHPEWFQATNGSYIVWYPWLWEDPTPNARPGGLKSPLAASVKSGVNPPGIMGPNDSTSVLHAAMRFRATRNFARAKALLRSVVNSSQDARELSVAAIMMLQLYRDSVDADIYNFVNQVWQQRRSSDPTFMLVVAKMMAQQSRVEEAAQLFNTVATRQPDTPNEKVALLDLFNLYYSHSQFKYLALPVLQRLQSRYGGDVGVEQASWLVQVNGGSGSFGKEAVHEPQAIPPISYALEQNYPNPFNPTTTISFALPKDSHVSLKLYDLLGREVKSLLDEPLTAGYHRVALDGSSLATGVYLYRMNAGSFVTSRKLLLMK